MLNRQLSSSFSPDRWPWLVLAVGGAGVLVRAVGVFQQAQGLGWTRFALSFVGQAAIDFSTVLAFFFLLRLLVNSPWFRSTRQTGRDRGGSTDESAPALDDR